MRKSINIAGFKHVNPIPNASRIGDLMMSGLVIGVDPQTGKVPPDLQQQCARMFQHVQSIVAAAGGGPKDIIKMSVWMANPDDRDLLNAEWSKMFPDPASRPARQTLAGTIRPDVLIQCDVTAVISAE